MIDNKCLNGYWKGENQIDIFGIRIISATQCIKFLLFSNTDYEILERKLKTKSIVSDAVSCIALA